MAEVGVMEAAEELGGARRDVLERLAAWAAEQEEIVAVYLFGSQVTGNTHPGSDLDVAVLARADLPRERLWRLEDRWSAEWTPLSGPEVDLKLLNLVPVTFRFEVITRGRLLWAADMDATAEFESLTQRRYWDLQPLLEQGWASFLQQMAEGRSEAEREEYETALEQVTAVHRRVRAASDDGAGVVQG